MTNILKAVLNIANNPILEIKKYYKSSIRIQATGDALDYYVKDLFANSIDLKDLRQKEKKYNEFFSYLGGANNPPDIIIKNGDAIEVKKVEHLASSIALNSSHPKSKLYSNDSLLTHACRTCEQWTEKDILYVIGSVDKITSTLTSLWMVYGNCYCADKSIYQRIKNTISSGLQSIEAVEFADTNEVGRVNKVDPLGITYFRLRGMWGIEHPSKVFGYELEIGQPMLLNVIMLKEKYISFPLEDRQKIRENEKLLVKDILIKNPNNPAQLLPAIYIGFKE